VESFVGLPCGSLGCLCECIQGLRRAESQQNGRDE
jgi:hypothetical protein